jgi:DNA polymerase III epsilon subunit-like protein
MNWKTKSLQKREIGKMDYYTRWDKVPDHLKTKTQLGKMGLCPAKGQEPVACFTGYIRGRSRPSHYDLYDVNEAQEKPKPTPAQLAALEKARMEWQRRRTCQRCGLIASRPLRYWPHCRRCKDHLEAIDWAREVLADKQAVILDTETTDLQGEPVEIAVINLAGEPLLDTLVQATRPIDPETGRVHGITEAALQEAPTFPEVYPQLCRVFETASRIITYNADFDFGILERARRVHGLPYYPGSIFLGDEKPSEENLYHWRGLDRAMEWYAQWWGQWSDYHGCDSIWGRVKSVLP